MGQDDGSRDGASAIQAIDIGPLLDDGPWAAPQVAAAWLAAIAIVLDGFDSQLIGFAIPVLIKAWGVSRGDFAFVVAAGLLGMAAGSALGGTAGDRLGRRTALIGSVVVFGVFTCLIGFAQDLWALAALRFVAGAGIGGALPSASVFVAEFAPARHRTLAVTAAIVCFPLGGMLAGLFAAQVLPGLGWRAMFWLGGLAPLLLAMVLALRLPESPRYLVQDPSRWPRLHDLLAQMRRPCDRRAPFIDGAEQAEPRAASLRALFANGRERDTITLWVAFFLCLLCVYSAFSWVPTLLTSQGWDIRAASMGLTAYNLGGVLGALSCAAAIGWLGSRVPMTICALAAAASALGLLMARDLGPTAVIVGLGLHGFCVNAVQSTLYAVATAAYPTTIRATGTASALAFGRLGAVLSAFAGAAVISWGGAGAFFALLSAGMAGVAGALLAFRRHLGPNRAAASSRPLR